MHSPIAVIGAGIVGVQIARGLQQTGRQVVLIDQADPGMATSFGNAGFIATDEIFPLAHGRVLRSLPRMLSAPLSPLSIRWQELPRLLPWFARYAQACSTEHAKQSIAALAALQGDAAAAWRRVIERDGLSHLIRDSGAWKLFETGRGLSETESERSVQKHYGIELESVPLTAIRERIPELGPSIKHGVYYPAGISVINSLAVTQALVERFSQHGGELFKAKVLSIKPTENRALVIETEQGESIYQQVIVAAGHLSGRLLKPLGLKVPIVAERGYHIEVDHSELSFDMPIGLHERGFYMTPMTSGLRLAGTSEISSADRDEQPNWARAEILKRHVDDILPGVARQETGRWMGHRPTLYDFLPALGPAPGIDGLYLAFGHHHLGLTLSAITAEIMADLLAGDRPSINIAPFALDRFQ